MGEKGKNVVVARKKIAPPSGQKSKTVLYFDGLDPYAHNQPT